LGSEENELLNELIIRNDTNSVLKDVTLRVPAKNIIVSTNLILPHREYSLGFQARENKRDAATLSWTYQGINYVRDIESVVSKYIDNTIAARVVITISANGQLQSSIVP